MQNNPASIWQHHPKTTSSPWHCSGINIYPLFFSCRVNFSLWGLLSIQADTHLSDRQKHMNTQLLPHRQTNSPKSSAFFFFSPNLLSYGNTGGRLIIQLGAEPGSQGEQYMSSVYTSRNENHTGNKHMLVSSQD